MPQRTVARRVGIPAAALFLLSLTGAAAPEPAPQQIIGESLVLAREGPGALLAEGIDPQSVVVRSTYLPGGTVYEAGRDYRFDAKLRTLSRLPGSRIPDFATNVLYRKRDFNHGQFPGFGNGKFFVYVDYTFARPLKLAETRDVSPLLQKTSEKLRAGKPLKVIAFGDSITAGGDASTVELQYPSRYAEHLRQRFPKSQITVENGSTGGDNTVMGLARLDEKVLSRSPDLVLVAFGMNDHNLPGGGGVEPDAFKDNLKQIVTRIREKTGAEVILLSTFPPNPDWHFSTHRMERYADATKSAASDLDVAYAKVYSVWQTVLLRKDLPSLLGNNINHPNDFGHWLYLQALAALEF
jgi:lysophospholipase L1-like esterase